MNAEKANLMKTNVFIFILLFCQSAISNAESNMERKAGIAGKYWGATILADEFSKTPCGRTANLSERYGNVKRAVFEIRAKLPLSMKAEIDQAFSIGEEQKARTEMRELIAMMDLNKCELAKKLIIQKSSEAELNWRDVN